MKRAARVKVPSGSRRESCANSPRMEVFFYRKVQSFSTLGGGNTQLVPEFSRSALDLDHGKFTWRGEFTRAPARMGDGIGFA